jgi:hypothetical protein
MPLWPRGRAAGIAAVAGLLVFSYVASYVPLSCAGQHCLMQSGELRWAGGLSVSDIVVWEPAGCRYQWFFVSISGERVSRGSFLGYLYAPFILLDRALFHPSTRLLDSGVGGGTGCPGLAAGRWMRGGVSSP